GGPLRPFTGPPAFRHSSFARRVGATSRPSLSSRTIGVAPTRSSTVGYSRAIAPSLDRDSRSFALPHVFRAHPAKQHEPCCRAGKGQREECPETVLKARGQEAVRFRLRMWVLACSRRGEDCGHDGHTDRAADLLARVQQSRGEPGLARRDAGERRGRASTAAPGPAPARRSGAQGRRGSRGRANAMKGAPEDAEEGRHARKDLSGSEETLPHRTKDIDVPIIRKDCP